MAKNTMKFARTMAALAMLESQNSTTGGPVIWVAPPSAPAASPTRIVTISSGRPW